MFTFYNSYMKSYGGCLHRGLHLTIGSITIIIEWALMRGCVLTLQYLPYVSWHSSHFCQRYQAVYHCKEVHSSLVGTIALAEITAWNTEKINSKNKSIKCLKPA